MAQSAHLASCTCGEPATSGSSRQECGRCYRRRLASLSLDGSVTETRTKRDYYDADALAGSFAPNAKDRMMEQTDGLGYAKLDRHGRAWHRNRHSGDVESLPPSEVNRVYLGGDRES